jgi:hypothetical protein
MRELAARGRVEDRIQLGPRRALIYRLAASQEAQTLGVEFDDNVIEVRIPQADATRWCATDLVGLDGAQRNGDVELRVTLEKDFDPSE